MKTIDTTNTIRTKTAMTPARLRAAIHFVKAGSASHFAKIIKVNKNSVTSWLTGKAVVRRNMAEHIYKTETLKHLADLLKKTEKDINIYLSSFDREMAMRALAEAQQRMRKMIAYIEEKHIPKRPPRSARKAEAALQQEFILVPRNKA